MSDFFLIAAYNKVNTEYPIITQITTIAVLQGLGDIIAQTCVERKGKFDYKRLIRFFLIGAIFVGPVLTLWLGTLDGLISEDSSYRAVKMVAIDQLIFVPIFVPTFLAVTGLFHWNTCSEIVNTVKRDTVSIILHNWMLWPAAQFINFNFIPAPYRILFASGVALFWNIYLSWTANRGLEKTNAGITVKSAKSTKPDGSPPAGSAKPVDSVKPTA